MQVVKQQDAYLYGNARKPRRLSAFAPSTRIGSKGALTDVGVSPLRGARSFIAKPPLSPCSDYEAKDESVNVLSIEFDPPYISRIADSIDNTPRMCCRRESKCSTFSIGPHHLRFRKVNGFEEKRIDEEEFESESVDSFSSQDVGDLSDFSGYFSAGEVEQEEPEYVTELEFSPIGKTLKYELHPDDTGTKSPLVNPCPLPVQQSRRAFRLFEATVMFESKPLRETESISSRDSECYSPVSVPPKSGKRLEFFDSWDDYTTKLLNGAKAELSSKESTQKDSERKP